ncbi:MAG: putative small protein [Sphingomonadales bacterium]|jgi:uncharacterized protein YodC (DUF2158 family)|nr:putative small protein [Sphingomonadales bacterium]
MAGFKAGDLVKLKAGGPKMVVEELLSMTVPKARCSWFAGAKHNKELFALASLEPWVDEGRA